MPEEILLPRDNLDNNKMEFELENLVLEVDTVSGELLRIISSNPGDYLLYQPGTKIDFIPQIY